MSERKDRIITRLQELSTLLGGNFTKWYTKNSVGEETTKYVITIKANPDATNSEMDSKQIIEQ